MRYAALLFLAAGAFAQNLPDTTPLESFFRTVDSRSRITEAPPAISDAPPTVQAALGFTDAEMRSLTAVAKAFLNRASSLRASSGEIVFQARLDFAETGKESETAKRQFKQMEAGLAEALTQAANQLRIALGDERYRNFDAWFQAGGATGCWVAPCNPTPRR